MCDIVNSPCKICKKDLPLHLGDYKTAPEEMECYCSKHLPEKDVSIFTLLEDDTTLLEDDTGSVTFKQGWKMGIRYLTANAIENKEINFPNIGADWAVEER